MIVEIEGRYVDSVKLKRKQLLTKKVIEYEIEQILDKYGFEKEDDEYVDRENYVKLRLLFFYKVV